MPELVLFGVGLPVRPNVRLWVSSRHFCMSIRCPLYPQKRTFVSAAVVASFTKPPNVLRGMGLMHLAKNEKAKKNWPRKA